MKLHKNGYILNSRKARKDGNIVLQGIIVDYSMEEIYNFDKTRPFYQALSMKTVMVSGVWACGISQKSFITLMKLDSFIKLCW